MLCCAVEGLTWSEMGGTARGRWVGAHSTGELSCAQCRNRPWRASLAQREAVGRLGLSQGNSPCEGWGPIWKSLREHGAGLAAPSWGPRSRGQGPHEGLRSQTAA